jgi:predicted nuclease of predicted toxin-antitoxin system
MKPLDYRLLADENIHPAVLRALADRGKDVCSVTDHGFGLEDHEILAIAHTDRRVVLTHDSDFGTLAIRAGRPYTGIIYLRPGHIFASFVLEIIDAIDRADLDVQPPFILVAERKVVRIKIRLRIANAD